MKASNHNFSSKFLTSALAPTALFLGTPLIFAGCSARFNPSIATNFAASAPPSVSASPAPTSSPSSSATPTPSPSATPTGSQLTNFYFGRDGAINGLQLNEKTNQVTSLAVPAYNGNVVGWLYYDSPTNTVLAADAGSTALIQVYKYNPAKNSLTFSNTLSFFGDVVNLSLARVGGLTQIFGADYNEGELYHSSVNSTFSTISSIENMSYGATAHTHYSTVDTIRGLLYVSNLGLNTISIYKLVSGSLQFLSSVPVANARTLFYDAIYDKLFVATESYDGASYIYSYAISPSGNSYALTNVGSLAMPMSGGDLKVNHTIGFVVATARNPGQESISGMPLTSSGQLDASRKSFYISLPIQTPRTIEITADGQYIAVASDAATTTQYVNILKLTFDANFNFVSSQNFFSQSVTSTGYVCSWSIPGQ